MRVLDALRGERSCTTAPPATIAALMPCGDVADTAVQLGDEVAGRVGDAGVGGLVAVQQRRARRSGGIGVEHRRQFLVVDIDGAAGLFGDRHGVGDDGGHPLPEEAHRVVEDHGVVGVVVAVLVAGGGERDVGAVTVGQDEVHARRSRSAAVVSIATIRACA